MNNQLSDEKFDQAMRSLLNEAAIDDNTVSEIADSPTMWWAVQRSISEQKTSRSPWPPVLRRWMLIGVPVAALVVLGITLLVSRVPVANQDVANVIATETAEPMIAPRSTESKLTTTDSRQAVRADTTPASRQSVTKAVVRTKVAKANAPTETLAVKKTEIKTGFIALTYARDPESGQIVRVKVPSSMMVTLGLVASVKRPTDMVDAEVLVGDDGLTRAIRFIR